MASDARYRTKLYLDTYWIPQNAIDDNSDALGMQTMYAYPEYPLELEFKAPSVIDVIIAIDQEESEPLMDPLTAAPYAYDDSVPVEVLCVDKSDVTATKTIQQAAAEMKRILETYPTSSNRNVKRITPTTQRLGSLTLWAAKFVWCYRRDTTT